MASSDHAPPTPNAAPTSADAIGTATAAPAGTAAPATTAAPAGVGSRGLAALVFVSALAFLLASFPARNGDLWMHLAAGRHLAAGSFSSVPHFPDVHPHATWLYDVACYAVYTTLGGPALVFFKALFVVALALIILRLCEAGTPGWIPLLCAVLAILTVSRRLLLQPVTVSYLFAALAFWFVRPERGGAGAQGDRVASPDAAAQGRARFGDLLRELWPFLVLFLLWANLDRWVLIGLGIVGLTWLGRVLDEPAARRRPLAGRLFVAFLVAAAVCLVSPSGLGAFTAPADLEWFQARADSIFAREVTSPFQRAYLLNVGFTPAGLAYLTLLGLGLGSFLLRGAGRRWQRALPWLALAALSAFEVRCLPFFAIVGGPVLAWNLRDHLARRPESANDPARRARAPQILQPLLYAVGGAVLLCAWPGWLQGPPFEPRRWDVEIAPALERAARTLHSWYYEGTLGPEARALHFSPDTLAAFAWFCPEENHRLLGRAGAAVWDRRLGEPGVSYVIVYHTDRGRLLATLEGITNDPEQWPLLYVGGDLAVFGWRARGKAGADGPLRSWEISLERMAFRPADDKKAPAEGPAREPEPRQWWEALYKPMPPASLDRGEATLYLLYAEAVRRAAGVRHEIAWIATQGVALAGAAGVSTPFAAVPDATWRLVLLRPLLPKEAAPRGLPRLNQVALGFQQAVAFGGDDTPPPLLYLAIRAARRAIAINPDDAQAHLALGEGYLRLLRHTRERAWGRRLREVTELRRVQAIAALNQAVLLAPKLAQAHLNLRILYVEMGYHDLALHHAREYLELARAATPPGAPAEIREEQARQDEDLKHFAEGLEKEEKAVAEAAPKMRVFDRATMALQRGLAGKALDILLESDVAAFGGPGMKMELDLLLKTGQAKKVREWTTHEQQGDLGQSYHWLRAQAWAAGGDYAAAAREMKALASSDRGARTRAAMARLVAQAIIDEPLGTATVPQRVVQAMVRGQLLGGVADLARTLRHEADATVIRGLLALEQGDVDDAAAAFRAALALWRNQAAAASGAALDFDGRIVAQTCLEWIVRQK
jgi:tetratricopeptide (TPR) repeat protein/uncharacterized membrane protein YhaH (DUF805 family)